MILYVQKFKTFTLCGTPEYIAPEVLLNKGHGKGVDWWTLGILIFETLCGQPPFNDDDHMGIYQQIIQGKSVHSISTFSIFTTYSTYSTYSIHLYLFYLYYLL